MQWFFVLLSECLPQTLFFLLFVLTNRFSVAILLNLILSFDEFLNIFRRMSFYKLFYILNICFAGHFRIPTPTHTFFFFSNYILFAYFIEIFDQINFHTAAILIIITYYSLFFSFKLFALFKLFSKYHKWMPIFIFFKTVFQYYNLLGVFHDF